MMSSVIDEVDERTLNHFRDVTKMVLFIYSATQRNIRSAEELWRAFSAVLLVSALPVIDV
nr:MAG TPA: hypothetical protein [Caudoviricetes sp.]